MPVPPETTLGAFLSSPTHASSSRSYFPRQHSESIYIFTYPCQFQQELFPETTSRSISILTYPCQFPPRQQWEHFYLHLPMPVPAGAISQDNTLRAFISLPTHGSSSRSYFLRQHSESISVFTYPCKFQQELFPETTLWEHLYLYLPMPVPAGAISRDNTLKAFLSLPTHASSSRSYFPKYSESISIFTYSCQFQQELFLETTLWKHFYFYLPMPVPAGTISPKHSESISIFTYPCQFQQELFLKSISIFTYACQC